MKMQMIAEVAVVARGKEKGRKDNAAVVQWPKTPQHTRLLLHSQVLVLHQPWCLALLGGHSQVPIRALQRQRPSPQRGMHHRCFQSRQRHCWCQEGGGGQRRWFCGAAAFSVCFAKVLGASRETLRATPGPSGVGCVLWFA